MKKLSLIGMVIVMVCAFIICRGLKAQGQISDESVSDDWDDEEEDDCTQTHEEGLAQDLELVAKAKGWTIEEAAADRKAADEVGRIAEQLAAKRPDVFVGSAVSDEPGGAPTLYVKGLAGPYVLDLVESAEIEINIADGQPFSFEELEDRQRNINLALKEAGYKDFMTFFRLEEAGQIRAVVKVDEKLPETASEILQSLPSEQRDYVRLSVSDRPSLVLEHAHGGMNAKLSDGTNWCTTGWTVTGSGVTTAGHCSGIAKIGSPGTSTHSFPYQSQHMGSWGDVEWHTAPDTTVNPKFYASGSDADQRWTMELEARASISEGESICVYGRASNDRDCSLDVDALSVSVYNSEYGVWVYRLVRMDGYVTTGGDSGGGWSWNDRAYGSHVGAVWYNNAYRNIFAVADLFDEAIGHTVKLACPGECTPGQTTSCSVLTPEGYVPGRKTCEDWCRWGNCIPL